MSRMFLIDGKPMKTWPIFVGCDFNCTYCNARKAALTRFKHSPRYRDGFKPKLVEKELRRQFKPGEFVFVAYMGDISFATRAEVELILGRISFFPETSFLFLTKNPDCYHRWELDYPGNLYLGGTIESNYDFHLTLAPDAWERAAAMIAVDHQKKFVSIEPIMDFDLTELTSWMYQIRPEIIEVGADNYHNNLPEPPRSKVEQLLGKLREICPNVVEKEGLERLRR